MLKIPEGIKQVSQNVKIVYFGVAIKKKKDPWGAITGKILMKQEVAVEDLFHFKGFEDVAQQQ